MPNQNNPILNFLGTIGGGWNDYQNYVNNLSSNMSPLEKWGLGGGNPLIARTVSNIPGDIGNIANSTLGLVQSAGKDIQNKGWGAIKDIPGGVGSAAAAVGGNINNLLGQPIGTDASGNWKGQLPSLREAVQNINERPVQAAMTADMLSSPFKGSTKTTQEVTPKIPGGVKEEIPKNAVETFKGNYSVPTKRAGMNDLNTTGTAQEILAHIKSGMSNDVSNIPEQVTGDSGIVTQMTRDALSKIQGEVGLSTAAKNATNVLKQPGYGTMFTPEDISKIEQDITRGSPVGSSVSTMNPLDAFDYQRALEKTASQFRRQDTYMTPNMKASATAEAYQAAANAVGDEINKVSGQQNILTNIKTPEKMNTLSQISPRLAQQVQDAKNISELRSTAAPFVKLSKMQELTDQASSSVFGKVAQGMQKPPMQPFTGGLTAAGGAIGGIPGAGAGYVVGNVIDRVLAPEYGGLINKIEQPLQNAIQSRRLSAPSTQEGLPPIVSSIGPAVASKLAVMSQTPNQQTGQNSYQGKSEHPEIIPSIYPEIKSDTTGHYQLSPVDTASPAFMTEQQREQLEQGLTPGTPDYIKIEQKFSQDQTMAKSQYAPEVAKFMQRAPDVQNAANKLMDAIPTLPIGIINKYKTFEEARKYLDPQFQSQVSQIQAINAGFKNLYESIQGVETPTDMQISPTDSAGQMQAKIAFMTNYFAGAWDHYKGAYAAVTSPTGTLTTNGQPQPTNIVTSSGEPTQPPPGMMQGGSLPSLNLPSLGLPKIPQ